MNWFLHLHVGGICMLGGFNTSTNPSLCDSDLTSDHSSWLCALQ